MFDVLTGYSTQGKGTVTWWNLFWFFSEKFNPETWHFTECLSSNVLERSSNHLWSLLASAKVGAGPGAWSARLRGGHPVKRTLEGSFVQLFNLIHSVTQRPPVTATGKWGHVKEGVGFNRTWLHDRLHKLYANHINKILFWQLFVCSLLKTLKFREKNLPSFWRD